MWPRLAPPQVRQASPMPPMPSMGLGCSPRAAAARDSRTAVLMRERQMGAADTRYGDGTDQEVGHARHRDSGLERRPRPHEVSATAGGYRTERPECPRGSQECRRAWATSHPKAKRGCLETVSGNGISRRICGISRRYLARTRGGSGSSGVFGPFGTSSSYSPPFSKALNSLMAHKNQRTTVASTADPFQRPDTEPSALSREGRRGPRRAYRHLHRLLARPGQTFCTDVGTAQSAADVHPSRRRLTARTTRRHSAQRSQPGLSVRSLCSTPEGTGGQC